MPGRRASTASRSSRPILVQEVRRLAAWRASPPPGAAPGGPLVRSFATSEARDLSLVRDLTLPLRGILDEDGLLGVRIGIGEMIANAVEHGNLGISASEKEQALADGRFAALLAARLAEPANAARRVHVETYLDGDEFRVTVRDEGAGFAWRALSARAGHGTRGPRRAARPRALRRGAVERTRQRGDAGEADPEPARSVRQGYRKLSVASQAEIWMALSMNPAFFFRTTIVIVARPRSSSTDQPCTARGSSTDRPASSATEPRVMRRTT